MKSFFFASFHQAFIKNAVTSNRGESINLFIDMVFKKREQIMNLCFVVCLVVKQDPLLDGLATNGTVRHPITAHLTSSMTTEEDHVLQSIQADGTHCL